MTDLHLIISPPEPGEWYGRLDVTEALEAAGWESDETRTVLPTRPARCGRCSTSPTTPASTARTAASSSSRAARRPSWSSPPALPLPPPRDQQHGRRLSESGGGRHPEPCHRRSLVTTDPTPEPIRIPLAHSVRYVVRGLPEVPNQYGPGVLAPSEITLTYRSAPDSGLGRVHAYVAGRIFVDGKELPLMPGGLYGQHYDEGLDGWPEWLAEEARLHDPDAAPRASVVSGQTLRDRVADLAEDLRYVLNYRGPGHAHEKPGVWDTSGKPCDHCARLAVARERLAAHDANPAAVLAELPPDGHSTNRADVLLWAADQIDAETRQAKADGVLEPDKYRPCRDASAQLRALAGCQECASGLEHDTHCSTPESHNWGCGCPSDRINLHAQSGIDTPGCDCGHDGMGLRWHSEKCAWVVGLLAEARELLATDDDAELRRVAAEAAQPEPAADLLDDYVKFLRRQGPEPDLSNLTPEQRAAVTGQFEIVRALADRDPNLPPIDRDPVARRLGLTGTAAVVPAAGAGQNETQEGAASAGASTGEEA